MTRMLTAAEIAALKLPDLPATKRAIQLRAEKEGWRYETKLGLGGSRKVYAVPGRYFSGDGGGGGTAIVGSALAGDGGSGGGGTLSGREAPMTNTGNKVVGAVVAGSAQGDMDRIQLVVRAVSEWEAERGVKISDDRRPAVIAVLYDYVKKAEESGEAELGIERFLKALG